MVVEGNQTLKWASETMVSWTHIQLLQHQLCQLLKDQFGDLDLSSWDDVKREFCGGVSFYDQMHAVLPALQALPAVCKVFIYGSDESDGSEKKVSKRSTTTPQPFYGFGQPGAVPHAPYSVVTMLMSKLVQMRNASRENQTAEVSETASDQQLGEGFETTYWDPAVQGKKMNVGWYQAGDPAKQNPTEPLALRYKVIHMSHAEISKLPKLKYSGLCIDCMYDLDDQSIAEPMTAMHLQNLINNFKVINISNRWSLLMYNGSAQTEAFKTVCRNS